MVQFRNAARFGPLQRDADDSSGRLMLAALDRAMCVRDAATHQHARRVRQYAVALAGMTRRADPRTLEPIATAALLHDIGKPGIPDRLLGKPGPLTRDEHEQVKQHAVPGADLLAPIPFPGPLASIVRHHHENWDGTGSPDRIEGEAIPIGARVLAIVDCYDALTSERPYRAQQSHEAAAAMITARRGSMFQPELVDAFLDLLQECRQRSARGSAERAPVRGRALRIAEEVGCRP